MITSKAICKAIHEQLGHEVELVRYDGIWYWAGEITENFEQTCTHMVRLSDFTIEQWVNDFEFMVSQARN